MSSEHKNAATQLEPVQLIKATLRLYRKYLTLILLSGVLLLIVSLVARNLLGEASFIATVIGVPVAALIDVFFIRYINMREHGKSIDLITVIKDSAGFIAPGLVIYTTVFVASMIGIILFIIPGIIVAIIWSMAFNYGVLEGKGVLASMRSSSKLTRGNRMNIFHTYWGLYLPFIVIALVLYAIFRESLPVGPIFNVVTSMLLPLVNFEIYQSLKKHHTVEK